VWCPPMFRFCSLIVPFLLAGEAAMFSQTVVSGEVLLKFAPGSNGRVEVEKALQTSPSDLAALAPIIEALQREVRLPLTAVRLASGGWILLKLDADRLVAQVAKRLGQRGDVRSVIPAPAEPGARSGTSLPKGLLVEFATRIPEPETEDSQKLAREIDLPLSGSIPENNRLRLEIDWQELTRILVERLKTLRDIEAAQPNYVLGIRPPS
jgi:hypothetical protein